MLEIQEVALEMVRQARPLIEAIHSRDGDLARQLRRAASSVVLNIAEGSASTRGTRRARYESAAGSANEVRSCLRVAEAMGYVEALDAREMDRIDRIVATLFKLNR